VVGQGSAPSAWSVDRFGDEYARQLRVLLPRALAVAVNRQIDTHKASGLNTLYAFGGAWPVVYEELVDHIAGLDGARVVRPRGRSFSLVMVNGNVLFPFRYANDLTTSPTGAWPALGLNTTCRDLLAAFGPKPRYEQGELFPVETAAPAEAPLGDVAPDNVVLVAFAASARAGLLSVGWGEAALLGDGGLAWNCFEMLPGPGGMAPPAAGGGPVPVDGPQRPSGPDRSSGTRRFDEAPLPDPVLQPRPASEQADATAIDPRQDGPLADEA
jgi:hypothetical protein